MSDAMAAQAFAANLGRIEFLVSALGDVFFWGATAACALVCACFWLQRRDPSAKWRPRVLSVLSVAVCAATAVVVDALAEAAAAEWVEPQTLNLETRPEAFRLPRFANAAGAPGGGIIGVTALVSVLTAICASATHAGWIANRARPSCSSTH